MAPVRQFASVLAGAVRMVWTASRRDLLLVGALQLMQGLGVLGVLLAIRAVLSAVLGSRTLAEALPAVLLLVLLQAGTGVLGVVLAERDQLLAELVRQHVQGRLLRVAGEMDYVAFETPALFDRLERASSGAGYGPVQLVQGLFALTAALAGVLGTAIALLVLQPLLVPVVLLGGVPLAVAAARVGAAFSGFFFGFTPAERERGYLASLLTSRDAAKEVRMLGIETHLLDRWTALTRDRLTALRAVARRRLRNTLAGSLIGSLVLAVALVGLVALITTGRLGTAEAGAAAAALLLLNQRLQSAGLALTMLFEGAPFVRDLAEFLDHGRRRREARGRAPAPSGFDRITVAGLGFCYPGADRPALRDVSLTLAAGQVVALVGENGSGKTTLATLLAGLHLPGTGRICWDDIDMATVEPAGWRSRVAVVFQDFVRFRLSARDNVGLGRADDREDLPAIREAAQRAGADEFLAALPAGYDTVLGPQFEGGVDLSGGQWQRVALARAFFRDVPLIILDEPTAALDPRAERELFDTIRALAQGRTVLLISHRYATVRSADLIVLLHDGEVVESGSHDDLLRRGGRYAELYTLQAASYG